MAASAAGVASNGRPVTPPTSASHASASRNCPPLNGSNSTSSRPSTAFAMKCPGSPTPNTFSPARVPTATASTESAIGSPTCRSMTLFR